MSSRDNFFVKLGWCDVVSVTPHCRDVAMLLRDPYALHAICSSIVKCLLQLSDHSQLPRVRAVFYLQVLHREALPPPFHPPSLIPPPLLLPPLSSSLPSSSLPLFLLPLLLPPLSSFLLSSFLPLPSSSPSLPHQESSELESLLRLLQLGLKSLNIMDTKDYREDNLVCGSMFTFTLAMYLKPFSQTGSFVTALGSACFLKF